MQSPVLRFVCPAISLCLLFVWGFREIEFFFSVCHRRNRNSLHYPLLWKASPHDEDEYLRMAMERYVKALDIDSDCFAAANGVGMVFARRGKPEIVA